MGPDASASRPACAALPAGAELVDMVAVSARDGITAQSRDVKLAVGIEKVSVVYYT